MMIERRKYKHLKAIVVMFDSCIWTALKKKKKKKIYG